MDKSILKDISYGMYVVSTNNGKNVGCIANSFCQITSSDLVVSISLNKNNYTNGVIKEVKKYALSIISEKTNTQVIQKFGFFTSKNINKFDSFEFEEINNLPVIKEECCGYLICEVFNIIDAGTHDIFLAKIVDCKKCNNNNPMTYDYYHKVVKGKAPQNAPTYIEEKVSVSSDKKYKCIVCGHIYNDAVEQIKFEDLPADWKCPTCGVAKSFFQEITN